MDRNQVEIELLRKDPEKLLLEYQSMIWAIVRKQFLKGLVKHNDQDDLYQEINKKLLERLPRIQEQYRTSSKLRTYFSKIIQNICLEDLRKLNVVMEPKADPYGNTEVVDIPVDYFLIQQEFERFRRIITMQDRNGQKLFLLLKIMNDLPVERSDLTSFNYALKADVIIELEVKLNACKDLMKKEKLAIFGEILYLLDGKEVPPDSLRKWFKTHLEECLRLMNGNPPRSSYNAESLGILLEKVILSRK
jgi:RNA polymerase sigma factor (sigma-70 family)